MRLFSSSQATQSEEDRARDLRLTYIASRYRVERSIASGADQPMASETEKPPEPPEAPE